MLVLYNGLSQARQAAETAPGTTLRVEVIGKLRRSYANDLKVGDLSP